MHTPMSHSPLSGGKRKLSKWNLFVKKVFKEGKTKNKNYSFKQALSDASKRKGEMGNMSNSTHKKRSNKKNKSCKRRRR
jgi:DNA-binding transcriptional regulator GbsR (MarR family)